MNVCFDCGVRLRKNEGFYIFRYKNFGAPEKRKVCDICNNIRKERYKDKYLKHHSRLMSWSEFNNAKQ